MPKGEGKTPFKVRKKGKTVGRRSKVEAIYEAFFAFQWAKPNSHFRKKVREAQKNALLYGDSLGRIPYRIEAGEDGGK